MSEPSWSGLSEEALLKTRIKDLHLTIEMSPFYSEILEVQEELREKDLHLLPQIYLGDEWFSPEGVPAISIPFYLAHPRLMQLEKKLILDVEGGDAEEFKMFLRHELGHVFDHCFQVSKRTKWIRFFGSPRKEYQPETYRPRPYSKNFVLNIPRWYAQAHPEEDFAETFAVWLNPKSDWKKTYEGWGALKKLEYVDALAKEFRGRLSTAKIPKRLPYESKHLSSTLEKFYLRKRRALAEDYPDFYDPDLLRIFSKRNCELNEATLSAARFMRKHRHSILSTISFWTRERKVTIGELLSTLIKRCDELDLVLKKSEEKALIETSALLTTMVSNYLFTGHFKRRA